jgi:hypothetical protein
MTTYTPTPTTGLALATHLQTDHGHGPTGRSNVRELRAAHGKAHAAAGLGHVHKLPVADSGLLENPTAENGTTKIGRQVQVSHSPETNARAVAQMMDRLDDLAADEKDGTQEYAELRDRLLAFTDQHPEIAHIVRASGYPV